MRYKLNFGIKNKLHKLAFAVAGLALPTIMIASAGSASAAPTFTVTPWTFVGATGDCGPGYPAGTPGGVVSKWDNTTGNPAPSLRLEKNVPTTDCSAAGATVNGVSGITLTELNFDYNGYCGAGAPRFNVVTSDNVTHFFGCASGTATPTTNGYTHVVFDPTNPAQAFPVIVPGTTVNSIDIVFDEMGQTNIDNISVNNQVIGGPNTPASKDACKNDGWKTLTDSNGNSFKNQGDCVSFVATGGKNTASPKH
jgi:hypothetical protein